MKRLRASTVALMIVLGLVFAGYVLYPLWMTFLESLRSGGTMSMANYGPLFDPANRANVEAVVNSVGVSLLSVVLGGLVGLLFAFVFTQFRFPLQRFLASLAVIPIALPPIVGVIAFLFVFGESGILPRVFQRLLGTRSVPFSLGGISAIVVVHVYSFYVYFYLLCSAALRSLDASLLEAAAGLGAGPWYTFRRVVFPSLRPAILGASILTFMASMASFSAPLLFAGAHRFLTLQIYTTKLNGEMGLAAAESLLLALVSLGFFVLLNLTAGRQRMSVRTRGVPRHRPVQVSRFVRLILIGLVGVLLLLELLPILTVVLISFAREGSWTWQLFPSSYTFENYTSLFIDPGVLAPIQNSLLMSLIALTAALLIGVGAAYLITKGSLRRFRSVADLLLAVPYAIPGTVIGISFILAFNTPSLFSGYKVLVGSYWILPLAYMVRTYPLIVRSTAASLEQLDDSLLEAGQSFGAGAWRRFRKIALPITLPGIISGALLAGIASLGEFVSSILLYTYQSKPIAVEILSQLRTFNFGGASSYSVILLLLILGLIALAHRMGGGIDVQGEPPQS